MNVISFKALTETIKFAKSTLHSEFMLIMLNKCFDDPVDVNYMIYLMHKRALEIAKLQ
ncbi:MAG: hypothetical protein Nk1A_7650 [Endomicrobiia bacterium]|nr:MAG: hypothetical protein Nk1A_7650 [Endomicrobiia bacterium]